MSEVAKRRKLTSTKRYASKIFSPFRVIGNVSNGTPFAVGSLGSTFYIVTSVGKSFQIYDANNLHLLFISDRETDEEISCLEAHFHYVYAGYGGKVGIYKRGILEHTIEVGNGCKVTKLCVFGDYLCVSTDNNEVHIFKKENSTTDKYATKFYTKFEILELVGGDIVSVLHMPTYLNKIVVVTKINVLLYNVRSGKLLYSSPDFPDQLTVGEAAPALDIIALGTISGEVILFNLRLGRKVRTIKVPNMRISSISFRTDGSSHICVGSSKGDILFYDLNRRARIHLLKNVHSEEFGGVTRASFLNGQPIIVTSGGDNSLKEYVFDPSLSQSDEDMVVQPPRFLRSRGGHSQPATSIAFADDESHFILSASRDKSVWAFSLRKDAQSQELSQRLHKKNDGNRVAGSTMREKFPEVSSIAIENARIGEWENILTAHNESKAARTWDMRSKRVGRWTFETIDDGMVKSVAISQCGNFGFVGSSNGGIGVYNMQSGMLRKKYRLHKRAVTGVAVDGMNRKMVSCGLDGIIGFYDFNESKYLGKLQMDAPITSMVYHRSSDLCAFALDDLSIVVVDTVTQKVVRQLWGHGNRITAFDFSPDGRWLVSASLDSTIRTWDLPTGSCIDGVKIESVATNLKFSPNGDMLATTHVIGNGIFIWTNRAQFKQISTKAIDEDAFQKIMLPNASVSGNSQFLEGAFQDDGDDHEPLDINNYQSVEQVNSELVTLSLGPRNKMNTILHLDVIKKRSKPKEAPKKPEKAPFFLQLAGDKVGDEASGREGISFETPEEIRAREEKQKQSEEAQAELTKFKPGTNRGFQSKFTKLLLHGNKQNQYEEFLEYLVSMSPATLDLEIRSLNSFEPFEEIIAFISALTAGLKTNKNYELYEAIMNLLFKAHGDVIHANNTNCDLQDALSQWETVHGTEQKMDELVKFCSSVLDFVSRS